MAGKIIVLPESLSSKIAAGEVVERPSSILKELVENAVDAGATDVTIELEKGGCGSIKVVDNGEGIENIDVPRAFERFATSKIYQFDDIYKVRSYGFRGEALPSIAAVSRVEMVTRKQPALSGTRLIIEAGQVKTVTGTGCPVGTSILVSHIFDPVPVRKKFLKKEMTEQGYCMDVMTRIALSRPEIKMRVVAHGREIFNIPAARDIFERVSLVFGMDFMDHMVSVKGVKGSITLTGLVSKPEYTRSGAKHLYYYVNKRFVRDYLLNHAVMTAYRRLIEAKRYPAVIMFVDFPPEDVDVNVHPAKMEVRFRNPKEVYDSIVETLATALANIAPVSSGERGPTMPDDYSKRVREALKRYTISSGSAKLFFNKGVRDSVMPESITGKGRENDVTQLHRLSEESQGEQEISCERLNFTDLEYIGQIAGTYLAFSSPAGLTLIDQHAAHERILFDKLKKGSSAPGEKVISQRLLLPELVSLAQGEYDTLMEYAKIFEDVGMEVEHFGEKTVIVKSVPAMLSHSEPKKLFFDILEEFSKVERSLALEERKEKMFALLACKGAVKANQKLSESEVAMLCRDLDATTFSSTCPHGRPVFISFTIRDMERMFKR